MATTSVSGDRKPYQALEKYPDAVFITDDQKLFFGNGGDFSIEYDEDGNDVVATAGADIRISDTQQIQFGDGGDTTITWDGSKAVISGGPLHLGNDVKLQFGTTSDAYITYDSTSDCWFLVGLPIADPGKSDALFVSDAGGSDLRISAG